MDYQKYYRSSITIYADMQFGNFSFFYFYFYFSHERVLEELSLLKMNMKNHPINMKGVRTSQKGNW